MAASDSRGNMYLHINKSVAGSLPQSALNKTHQVHELNQILMWNPVDVARNHMTPLALFIPDLSLKQPDSIRVMTDQSTALLQELSSLLAPTFVVVDMRLID